MHQVYTKTALVCTFILFGIFLKAQTIEGTVYGDGDEPLYNATILKNDNTHNHTNISGKYSVEAEQGDTLTFSYLGYEDYSLVVDESMYTEDNTVYLNVSAVILNQISITNSVKEIANVSKIDLSVKPVRSSQEVLNQVPGLFIAQHAGGGKAEQIFLRGFDIDHGTDIAITVDGLPVNMVSHAHGQGYADLHFLIPETIENIDFGKGPYYTDQGNFTTAGYVNFQTKDKLDKSLVSVRLGQFNTGRLLGLFNLTDNIKDTDAYIGGEYIQSDGPFDASQNFNRMNLIGKYKTSINGKDKVEIAASYFKSSWDASGQIPVRAIESDLIGRFGAIDSTEGGATSRLNLSMEHFKVIDDNTFITSKIYHVNYDFELFSNFTFFLDNPVDGDQIRQFENRSIYGLKSTFNKAFHVNDSNFDLQLGVGLRYDDVNENELSNSRNRTDILNYLALGDVDETNYEAVADLKWSLSDWTFNIGSRIDVFRFQYNDLTTPLYDPLSNTEAIISPKLNIIYNPSGHIQYYLKSGKGFHSNDSRLSVRRTQENILPAAYGTDLGVIWKPTRNIWVNTALWYLFLEQEFVYVGDAAIVEPSGRTSRKGIDLTLRYQIMESLLLNTDINYTIARSIDDAEGENRIPLAPELTSVGGLTYTPTSNFDLSLRYKYIRDRAANEDNSIVALGYNVFDLTAAYRYKNFSFILNAENLFDTEWNEAQFATESRLSSESEPVEELHFTPGNPRNVSLELQYRF